MAMFKKIPALLLLLSLVLPLASCSKIQGYLSEQAAIRPPESTVTIRTKYGLACNAPSLEGSLYGPALKSALDQGLQQNLDYEYHVATRTGSDTLSAPIQQLINLNCTLIFAADSAFQDVVLQLARENPGVKFVCMDADYMRKEVTSNLLSLQMNINEGFYLAGYMLSKIGGIKSIGYMGSVAEQESHAPLLQSYIAGAQMGNPAVKVHSVFVNRTDKPSECTEKAADLYNGSGAGCVFYDLPQSLLPDAAALSKSLNKGMVTVDAGAELKAKGLLYASVDRRADVLALEIITNLRTAGTFDNSIIRNGTLSNNAISLGQFYSPLISKTLVQDLEDISRKIGSGEIQMP